jgi:hypothetical protein
MAKARDIIKAALRKIEVLGSGKDLSAEDASDGLEALNGMISAWSVEGAMIYTETKETFNLTSNKGSYTIGSGGDFDTTRPTKIDAAYVRHGGVDYPLTIEGKNDYSIISDKESTGIPSKLYYDENYPLGNIYLWPVPSGSMEITLVTEKPLSEFSSLNTEFAMPPEYKRALIFNLAVEISPEYGRTPHPNVSAIARTSKSVVKTQNRRNDKKTVAIDSAFVSAGSFNIRTGRYN